MLYVSIDGSVGPIGPTSDLFKNEILRVGASAKEVQSALAFIKSEASLDQRAYDALPPRVRRLVDLVAVEGDVEPIVLILEGGTADA